MWPFRPRERPTPRNGADPQELLQKADLVQLMNRVIDATPPEVQDEREKEFSKAYGKKLHRDFTKRLWDRIFS